MSFAENIWLYSIPAALLGLGILFLWAERRSRHRLARFATSKLVAVLTHSYSRPRQFFKMALVLIAACLLFLSMARPQYGFVLEESETQGLDIMFALDTSRSMLAEDIAPNRLERAKLAIVDLLSELSGDRVGLIAFAGEAFLQIPLTNDHQGFRQTLTSVDTRTIPRGGTDIAAAIREARQYLSQRDREKLLILISDGEDLGREGIEEARLAGREGIRIFTVGVGSPEGAPILITLPNGDRDFIRDASGQPVRSALDERTLQQIAAATEGIYVPLGSGGTGLRTILEEVRTLFPEMQQGIRVQQVPLERYQWPLAAALLLLLLEPLLGTRRRQSSGPRVTPALLWALVLFPLFIQPAEASPQRALQAYQRGEYDRAAELYAAELERSPDNARLQYNYGIVLYRLSRWAEAQDAFTAALRTTDPTLQANAFFNLGNSLFQQGLEEEDTFQGRTRQRSWWEQAREAYSNAQALDPQSEDIKRNFAIVEQALQAIIVQLDMSVQPLGAGEVKPGSGTYVRGAHVSIEAEAGEGWLFRRWIGGAIEDPLATRSRVLLDTSSEVVAQFVRTWQLTVDSAHPEAGTAGTSGRYPEDEPITIRAEAEEHFVFHRWNVQGPVEIADPRSPETQVQLSGDATVTALFEDAFLLKAALDDPLSGYTIGSGWHPVNSEVPIQAEPREGFSWVGWLGENVADPESPETTVLLDQEHTVTALMQRDWNLIVIPYPEEGGEAEGSSPEPVGTRVPLHARPNEGYRFDYWVGEGVADPFNPETYVTITSAEHNVFARFEAEESEDSDQDQEDDSETPPEEDPSDPSGEDFEPDPSDTDETGEDPPEDEEPAEPENEESPSDPEEQASEEETEPAEPEALPAERGLNEMTAEEAMQLLNILRENENILPATQRPVRDIPVEKDW